MHSIESQVQQRRIRAQPRRIRFSCPGTAGTMGGSGIGFGCEGISTFHANRLAIGLLGGR